MFYGKYKLAFCKNLVLFVFLLCFSSSTYAETEKLEIPEKIKISVQDTPLNRAFAEYYMTDLYGRLGIEVEFFPVPSIRSAQMANAGIVDADIARKEAFTKVYTNMVRVPEPLSHMRFNAYTKIDTPEIANSEELSKLRVGALRGVFISEKDVPVDRVVYADNTEHLFLLLERDRVDVSLIGATMGQAYFEKNIDQTKFKNNKPYLLVYPLYHHIHKKHAHLAPKLAEIVKEFNEQKKVQKFFAEYLKKQKAKESTNQP